MESLGDVLEKHIPHPQDEISTSKKKKVRCFVLDPQRLFVVYYFSVALQLLLSFSDRHTAIRRWPDFAE